MNVAYHEFLVFSFSSPVDNITSREIKKEKRSKRKGFPKEKGELSAHIAVGQIFTSLHEIRSNILIVAPHDFSKIFAVFLVEAFDGSIKYRREQPSREFPHFRELPAVKIGGFCMDFAVFEEIKPLNRRPKRKQRLI